MTETDINDLREYLALLERQYALAVQHQTPAVDYLKDRIDATKAKLKRACNDA